MLRMENRPGMFDADVLAAEAQLALGSDLYDYDVDGMFDSEIYSQQLKAFLPEKRYVHPLIVLLLLVVCFPAGIVVMLFFTRWGAFPKTLVTVFVLCVAVAVYEILVAKHIVMLPSLFDLLAQLFTV